MKTIDIKGKQYVPVNERLKYFRENFQGYRLLSELVSNVDGVCVFKATVYNEKGEPVASGYSQEKEADTRSMVNKTSYIENSETSSWGRALGNFGIGIDSSVASADEVANAINTTKADHTTKKADTDNYYNSVMAKIQVAKTREELKAIWKDLDENEQDLYIDKIQVRQSVLDANK